VLSSTKGWASLVIDSEAEKGAGIGVAEAEGEVTGKCNGIQLGHFINLFFFIAGAELKILNILYYFTKKNLFSYHNNTTVYIYIVFLFI